MSTDPGNTEQSGRPDRQSNHEFAREILSEFLNSSTDVTVEGVFDRILERGGFHTPPTTDEEGNPLPRLDLDNPPATPDDPLLRVAYALVAKLPEQWENVTLQVTGAADDIRTVAVVRVQGDRPSLNNLYFFTDLAEPCLALRQSTYEPGRGAWYYAFIQLFRDGTIDKTYNYVTPPFGAWGHREVDLVLRDHELYPRDPDRLPPWHPAR